MRLLATLLAALSPAIAYAQIIDGPAEVIDGDTLIISGETIRLHGIDAPELDQTCTTNGSIWRCGEEARSQLQSLVEAHNVICAPKGKDSHDLTLATCSAGRFPLNSIMVEEGWAVAYLSYSQDYEAEGIRARAARKGIWSSEFTLPEYHRLAQRQQSDERSVRSGSTATEAPRLQHDGSCTIKGNRSRRGKWIYHLPGMPYYDATRPEEIFCSEEVAQAAGYRRARVR